MALGTKEDGHSSTTTTISIFKRLYSPNFGVRKFASLDNKR